jgi:hypothetical protein
VEARIVLGLTDIVSGQKNPSSLNLNIFFFSKTTYLVFLQTLSGIRTGTNPFPTLDFSIKRIFPFRSVWTLKELGKSSIIEMVSHPKARDRIKRLGIEVNYEAVLRIQIRNGKSFGGG